MHLLKISKIFGNIYVNATCKIRMCVKNYFGMVPLIMNSFFLWINSFSSFFAAYNMCISVDILISDPGGIWDKYIHLLLNKWVNIHSISEHVYFFNFRNSSSFVTMHAVSANAECSVGPVPQFMKIQPYHGLCAASKKDTISIKHKIKGMQFLTKMLLLEAELSWDCLIFRDDDNIKQRLELRFQFSKIETLKWSYCCICKLNKKMVKNQDSKMSLVMLS